MEAYEEIVKQFCDENWGLDRANYSISNSKLRTDISVLLIDSQGKPDKTPGLLRMTEEMRDAANELNAELENEFTIRFLNGSSFVLEKYHEP